MTDPVIKSICLHWPSRKECKFTAHAWSQLTSKAKIGVQTFRCPFQMVALQCSAIRSASGPDFAHMLGSICDVFMLLWINVTDVKILRFLLGFSLKGGLEVITLCWCAIYSFFMYVCPSFRWTETNMRAEKCREERMEEQMNSCVPIFTKLWACMCGDVMSEGALKTI